MAGRNMFVRRPWLGRISSLIFPVLLAWIVILVLVTKFTARPQVALHVSSAWHRPVIGPYTSTAPAEDSAESIAEVDVSSNPMALVESMAGVHAYAPLQPNILPLYNITIGTCIPLVGCIVDKIDDHGLASGWIRVDKPLRSSSAKKLGKLARVGANPSYWPQVTRALFYRRAYGLDGTRIVDIRSVSDVEAKPEGPGWHKVHVPMRIKMAWNKAPQTYLYFRTATPEEHDKPITELAITYGDNPSLPQFSLAATLSAEQPASHLYARRTVHVHPKTPQPKFHANGTFTILQFADLHFSVEQQACRDVADVGACRSHNDTLALLEQWLDEEHPDLVVFTGDQLNGQGTSWDEQSVISLWLAPIIRRKIPWMALLGNHDAESGFLTRHAHIEFLAQLPYSLTRAGPREMHGAGNYDVAVRSPNADQQELLTLWGLDSGANAKPTLTHPWKGLRYDYIHQDQVEWVLDTMLRRAPAPWPYTPPAQLFAYPPGTNKSQLGPRRLAQDALRNARPPGIMFVHIPIPEAFDAVDHDASGRALISGVREEKHQRLGGQAERGIFAALASVRSNETLGVQLFVHGHMHNNDDCRRIKGTWICFGGGASYAAYGKVGFPRRARVYEVGSYGQTIKTWHRMDNTTDRMQETELET
ncbi:Phosphatase dcr2 [Malassezia vespertilionis]|uniref:Calcineurin-like phosphoesterase domain-containing protein n=1 Tax=Malassezia vespertilionis TaxID=2020962 RepID=A0A2N1J9R0_9BASI|nr:Phosphatase dcr2 [Malassezia vespertilionis]PKI83284.1 hypothetical protein MVES_003042 [Malassezia vespertilionis]WFD07831.1 Phosphatase dcr2 [Malassezia vespertilionis]